MRVTLEEAKASRTPGTEFEGCRGVTGVILAEKSGRGKVQAELTCAAPGCTNTHIREISDWHQCSFCSAHKTNKSKAGGNVPTTGRQVKLPDGTVLREMRVEETDDEEMKALKMESNALLEELLKQKKAEDEKRKVEQEKARLVKVLEEKRKEARAMAERAAAYAAERGLKVSPKLQAELEATETLGEGK